MTSLLVTLQMLIAEHKFAVLKQMSTQIGTWPTTKYLRIKDCSKRLVAGGMAIAVKSAI